MGVEHVNGIGGVFFKAEDAGPTVFAPFGAEHWDSPHLGRAGWGINFRVADLEAMVAQLRSAGIEVDVDTEEYPNGSFAQLQDPEGNSVQLWQPS